jgi:hypothetical protein
MAAASINTTTVFNHWVNLRDLTYGLYYWPTRGQLARVLGAANLVKEESSDVIQKELQSLTERISLIMKRREQENMLLPSDYTCVFHHVASIIEQIGNSKLAISLPDQEASAALVDACFKNQIDLVRQILKNTIINVNNIWVSGTNVRLIDYHMCVTKNAEITRTLCEHVGELRIETLRNMLEINFPDLVLSQNVMESSSYKKLWDEIHTPIPSKELHPNFFLAHLFAGGDIELVKQYAIKTARVDLLLVLACFGEDLVVNNEKLLQVESVMEETMSEILAPIHRHFYQHICDTTGIAKVCATMVFEHIPPMDIIRSHLEYRKQCFNILKDKKIQQAAPKTISNFILEEYNLYCLRIRQKAARKQEERSSRSFKEPGWLPGPYR